MSMPAEFFGAVIDPRATDAVCMALAAQGRQPLFGAARPDLRGFGDGKSYLHSEAERKLFGKTLPSWSQRRGTCVAQGTGRGLQDAIYSAMAFGGAIGKIVEICFEPLYGGSRVQIGKGSLGSGDGSCGCWCAQYSHDFGLLPRGVYGSIDLSKPREELAIQWGQPHTGVPQSLQAQSAGYKAAAAMKLTSVEDVRDALVARHAVARCANRATSGQRDAAGICRPQPSGGHCQELSGVYIDRRGDILFVEQQSWGPQGPQGGGSFKLSDGREIEPREGESAIYPEDVQTYLREGEIWAIEIPQNLWRDETLKPSDLVK